jgi:release factor glutamine methyltransferase
VFAEDEATVLLETATSQRELSQLLARRTSGEPLEQVVGWVQFGDQRVCVAPGVFVPRQRSRLLAARAVLAARQRAHPVVVELCCGTAAIAAAVGVAVPQAQLYATDLDERAVACARTNLQPLGGCVLHGDLFAALPSQLLRRVDVLVANAPYVPTGELGFLPIEARKHEPRSALDGGPLGLTVLFRIITGASGWLARAGVLLVECSTAQVDGVVDAMRAEALATRVITDDDFAATVVEAEYTQS